MRFSRKTKTWIDNILSSSSEEPSSKKPASTGPKKPPAAKAYLNNSSKRTSLKRQRRFDDSERVRVTGGQDEETTNMAKRLRRMSNNEEDDHIHAGVLKKSVGDQGNLLATSSVTCEISSHSGCESPVTVLPSFRHHREHGISTTEIKDLSPTQAARVAKIKSRFAVTILKANCPETNEAMINKYRAVESAKANEFVTRQLQRDREAARRALDEMEKNVVIEDNFKTMKEFEMLISGQGHLLV